MQTAQSQNQPSLPELFNQLNELNKANMTSKVSEMSFGGIDPAILQQTVADGGPLSGAANFADSSAWTMTPEMFKQTIASRPDAMAEAGRATSLSDAVFGRTAKQKALLEAQAQDVASRGRTLQTAGQMYEGGQDRTARAAEGAANRANQMEIQKLQEAGADRRQAKQLALEERKQTKLAQLLSAGNDFSKMPLVSQDLSRKYEADSRAYLDKDGKINRGNETAYYRNYMLSTAYSGNVRDGYVQKLPAGYKTSSGKAYDTAVFRRNQAGGSWYGVTKDQQGRLIEDRQPLVTAYHPMVEAQFGGSKKSEGLADLYR